ncbi:MAG: hypothetical protein AB1466_02330 [Actinomycetota bacterium]
MRSLGMGKMLVAVMGLLVVLVTWRATKGQSKNRFLDPLPLDWEDSAIC